MLLATYVVMKLNLKVRSLKKNNKLMTNETEQLNTKTWLIIIGSLFFLMWIASSETPKCIEEGSCVPEDFSGDQW